MFQNIKVDVVYYKTNTDFELEFNLSGCCRMRLLTDKASDPKSFVHHLARAVSRSRVILVSGGLFGENGILQMVARAIGKSMTVIDNRAFGISGHDAISIINGATPLVTPEGYFGGCIIESGPQTMIVLTDSKMVRKTIMNTLIHPYIEELCALELKEKAAASSAAAMEREVKPPVFFPQEPPLPTEEPFSAPETPVEPESAITPDPEPEIPMVPEIPIVPEAPMEPASPAESAPDPEPAPEPVSEPEVPTDSASDPEPITAPVEPSVPKGGSPVPPAPELRDKPAARAETSQPEPEASDPEITLSGGMVFESDDAYFSTENRPAHGEATEPYQTVEPFYTEEEDIPDEEHRPGFFAGSLPLLILSVFLLAVLAVLCYCIFYIPSKNGVSPTAYLQETFRTLFG